MKFKPGQSGNPTGRTPSEVARAPLREAITKGLPAVITKLQSLAENGSTEAARLLLDRGLPAFKPTAADVSLPAITAATTHTDAARAVNVGVAQGMANRNAAKTAVDMALLYAVLGSLLKDALTPGDADKDNDKLWKKLLGEQLGFLFGLFVVGREFGEAAKNLTGLNDRPGDYSGPAGVRMVSDAYALGKQAQQGEFDDAFRKATINLTGDLFALLSAQMNRSITGAKALASGETSNPAALLFGHQKPN